MTRQTNNILRRLSLALLLTTATVRGWGDGVETLTFFVNGSPVRIMLADRPAITYTGNTLHVRTTGSYFDIPVSIISAGVFQAWAMPGDVNTDGQVGIGDIVAITNFMAGNTGGMTEAQADVNGDGDVGIGDIVAITNIMAGTSGTTEPSLLFCPDDNHPHMIDLGLPSGTKWACCNVGASKPEDYGSYFAWGETSPKSEYSWETYLYGSSDDDVVNIGANIAGTAYDAAAVNWGSEWCMPTQAQMEELVDNCTSEWTTQNGVNGKKFTGGNGKSVFLPAAGVYRYNDKSNVYELKGLGEDGDYWSSTLREDLQRDAHNMDFDSHEESVHGSDDRYEGKSVRPVR